MEKGFKEYRYDGMSDKQVEVLNRFTQFKSATSTQKKMAEIIGDTEITRNWTYEGYKDTGRKGNDHCSMGHALRYVHFAKNKETKEQIKFGIKCISDFFEITVDKLKMIQEGFVQTNKMVDEIVAKFKKGGYRFEEMEMKLSQLNQGIEYQEEIAKLLEVKLPLPYQYENEINEIWFKEYNGREFQKFLDENPQYAGIVVMAQMFETSDVFKSKHPILYKKMSDIVKYLNNHKTLSEPQIKLLNKIIMLDTEEIDEILDDLHLVNSSKFKKFGDYNEYVIFLNLERDYNEWGLSIKQVDLLKKIHSKLKKEIDDMKELELAQAE